MRHLGVGLWGTLALRGAITLALGVGVILWPQLVVGLLVTVFGGYAVLNGLIMAIGALAGRRTRRWWWLALGLGALSALLGLAMLAWPQATVSALVMLIGVWALVTGAADLLGAIRQHARLPPRVGSRWVELTWLQGLSGVLSLAFALALLLWTDVFAGMLVGLIGAYGIVTGALLLVVAWRLRDPG